VLLRLTYLGVTNALALLRLLPMSDRDKDAEILALRHQVTVHRPPELRLGGPIRPGTWGWTSRTPPAAMNCSTGH
jgi:hypothetical protein